MHHTANELQPQTLIIRDSMMSPLANQIRHVHRTSFTPAWTRRSATSYHRRRGGKRGARLAAIACSLLIGGGCRLFTGPYSWDADVCAVAPQAAPRELEKAILPDYRIEPPDVLLIEAVNIVSKPPYHFNTLDAVHISVKGTLPESPIDGVFRVEPGGVVALGEPYGTVKISGLTPEDAQQAIEKHLSSFLKEPAVFISLVEMSRGQQIAGEHLVALDGTVNLGTYGRVSVVGMTIDEAQKAIQEHLSQYLENPEISLDVFAYNSKVYYVITQGGGLGDGVTRYPVTGNETVLDAISQISGLTSVSSKRIWIARPTRGDRAGEDQILPVDWLGISQRGETLTNYQVMPGDRIYVAHDKLIAFDTALGKIIAPFERIMGFTMLGTSTIRTTRNIKSGVGGGGGGF